ncbi:Peptidyl-prolyl cis-trans isomerase D [Aquicella siphonis]|uniref:Periplasmic chaperone PpiD n=1 Tax=Aquicella siphonis TaxID=254247 RepID=A0A5E4PGY4_9COXI|nr:SurA N-terminal domain-containing protein [Aquicella siphonis]VVC75778.1 Peptidyl-prolyl cis-trans isomerase D [Aquicella siphonis]
MLQTIREHTQGWIAGTIITIIILSFALWGIHSYFVGGAGNVNVAEVNGVEITKEQLAVSYERLRRQVQHQFGSGGSITSQDEAALKQRAMQALIDIEVLKQASTDQGFRVSDRQIDNYLQSMPEFQVNGQFSLERFQEILSSTLLSTSEFLELIRTSLLVDQPKLGFVFTSFALPDESAETISLVNQERDIDYITIPIQYFLSQPIVISPKSIQSYYDQNKSDFMTPEQVNVEYIQLSLKEISAKFNPTEVMLKSFYNENINSYTQPTQWKISSLEFPVAANASADEAKLAAKNAAAAYEALKSGGDLANSASQYSANLANEGWMTLSQVPAEQQKAVSGLTKAGEVSEPFKTSKGWVVVKAVEIQEPKMLSFAAVKDKVKEAYIHQHAEEKFAELRDQLADLTYEHPESLQLAAKTMNLPIHTSELFTKDKQGKDISQYKKVRDTAFSNDVLNLQNNSDVIQLNPETLVVIRVKSHVASSLLPLSEISKQIEEKLKSQEAEARAAKFAEDLQAKLQSGSDPEQIAKTYKLKWVKAGFIGRYSNKVDSAILDLAFRLPNPADQQNKVSYGAARLPNGYGLVALKSVKSGSVADKKQLSVYTEQIQNSEGLLEYELYKRSQMDHAKINVNLPAA